MSSPRLFFVEFFLHHEGKLGAVIQKFFTEFALEQYHSTPETQTDESYTHPEDLEHFAAHEAIERKEVEREAAFQGLTVEEILKALEDAAAAEAAHQADAAASALREEGGKPVTRVTPPEKQEPAVKFKDAKTEGDRKGEWGTGAAGYKPPTEPGDKMRCVLL